MGIAQMFTILFYQDKRGRQPVKEYMDSLQSNVDTNKDSRIKLKKIYEYIEVLACNGTRAGEKYTKYIEDDIWELRPLSVRIFFFYWKENTFILLHQFQKKTQKTPKKEIEQAKRNKRDFIERSKNHAQSA